MITTAPPRPPRPSDPVDRDALEALIEEARRRARRRRLMYAAGAALVALAGVANFTVFELTPQSESSSTAPATGSAVPGGTAGSKIAFISAVRRCPRCTGVAPDHLRQTSGVGALYVMNPDGSGQRVVTRDASSDVAWSPDGQKFAFNRDWDSGIYLIGADGSGERRLTRSGGGASWSPDGRKIAFTKFTRRVSKTRNRWQISEINEIHVMNADGSGQRKLTSGRRDHLLTWLPNGRIAFVRHTRSRAVSRSRTSSPWTETFDLYVTNANGSGQRNLTRQWRLDARQYPGYLWSRDGRKIAFTSERDGNPEIYVVNADGRGERRLTRSRADDGSHAWSPDGRKIVFVRSRGHTSDGYRSDIYAVNADGSGERRLTVRGARPRWSPDGKMIAFLSERDGNPELYVMNADGSGQRRLTRTTAMAERHFAWSPAQQR